MILLFNSVYKHLFTTFYLVSAFLCLILSEILSIVNKKTSVSSASAASPAPCRSYEPHGSAAQAIRFAQLWIQRLSSVIRPPSGHYPIQSAVRSLSRLVRHTFTIPLGQTYVHYPARSDICSLSRSIRHTFTIPLGQTYLHYPARSAICSLSHSVSKPFTKIPWYARTLWDCNG